MLASLKSLVIIKIVLITEQDLNQVLTSMEKAGFGSKSLLDV